jgi:hypothetical protein
MNGLPYVRYKQFKSVAKLLSKRFAIQLSRAQESLSRASGYGDLNQLQSLRQDPLAPARGDPPRVIFAVWMRRMQVVFGDDLNALITEAELLTWCRRIHGRLEGDLDLDDTLYSDSEMGAQGEI